MSFNYDKHKNRHDDGSFWTSYSDLFLGMSVIFLLLYVTASLRTGTDGMRQASENKRLAMEVEDLKTQLKAYDSVRKDYLNTTASPDETKQYQELMDKLTLLQEEAKNEKDRLNKEAKENENKAKALNQYQQMVRNIINANTMAKTKIQKRENVITEQDTEIDVQSKQISDLKLDISEKKSQIDAAQNQLEKRLSDLKAAYKKNKMTEAAYKKQVSKIKEDSESKVSQLKGEIRENQLAVSLKTAELEQTKADLASKAQEAARLAQQKAALATQKEALEGEKVALLGAKQSLEGEKQVLTGALDQERKGKQELGKKVESLGSKLKDTEGLLKKAQADADARKKVARDIKEAFKKAGVGADVDDKTGEVTLTFGDVYFDNDSAKLKSQMKETLKKAMPGYAKSLLGNQKISSKISSVEIVGFASPTYKGKIVDPKNLDPAARKAVDYNLDLSYQRARAMFQYVFNEKNMKFEHQKDMLPLIKVTGRSFLADEAQRKPAGKGSDFCSTHDCRKAQRVIIRFNFDENK